IEEYDRYNQDLIAAANERLDGLSYDTEKAKKSFRDISAGKEKLSESNTLTTEKLKRENQAFLSEKEREASNQRYDKRKELFDKDHGQKKHVDDYILPEGAEDLPEGISENSYQLNEGRMTVIERTVKIGNRVQHYRKVISKTGTYYFKNDRSITEQIWKSETQNIGD
ncbi:MAG: hypothetical protein HKN32_02275, partial [Flavobacteriales bacterium]|nr:hypothetical protein [Flavobacteriales bacterium]